MAIVGAGITGLTLAAALRRAGIECAVYEKATAFTAVGAGIQLAPNAVGLLHRLGLADRLAAVAVRSSAIEMRDGHTGGVVSRIPLDDCETLFGAPYYLLTRADLHAILASSIPAGIVHLGKECLSVDEDSDGAEIRFTDGTSVRADVVVGADGIHSAVRQGRLRDQPVYSGFSAYRGLVLAEALPSSFTEPKSVLWTGTGKHVVCYPVAAGRMVNFVATVPVAEWHAESWSEQGEVEDLVAAFAGWHDDVRTLFRGAGAVTRWAVHAREAGPRWSTDRTTLAGDAAHPMLPFLAQGANQGVEDALALAAALSQDGHDVSIALKTYELARQERTLQVQQLSKTIVETFHQTDAAEQRDGGTDSTFRVMSWLFGHDAESLTADS
ncbi:MAG: FAD-dependent monooxygenase [Umezawaea sp.]